MKKAVTVPVDSTTTTNLSFEVPTQFVPLPSEGKLYNTSSNLHDQEHVEIRVMTAKDEDILTSPTLIKKGVVIDRLLQNVLIDKAININEMIRGDRDALLISLRITGYGANYETAITCPICDSNFEHTFDLSQIPIKRLEIEPLESYTNQFSYVLPISNKEVICKFLTAADENEMVTSQKKRKASLKVDVDNLITLRLIHSILAIDGVTDRGNIAKFVRNMPAQDSLGLRTFLDENEPRAEMKQIIECTECGDTTEVAIPMAVEFLWPKART